MSVSETMPGMPYTMLYWAAVFMVVSAVCSKYADTKTDRLYGLRAVSGIVCVLTLAPSLLTLGLCAIFQEVVRDEPAIKMGLAIGVVAFFVCWKLHKLYQQEEWRPFTPVN